MLTRDPDWFLSSLYEALKLRHETVPNDLSHQALSSFYAAKYAVVLRLAAVDRLAEEFKKFASEPNWSVHRDKRLSKENQLLFDFFANALSALESFCFGSYYVGVALDPVKFGLATNPRAINPKKVRKSFQSFDSTSPFTRSLEQCLASEDWIWIDAMRNLLLHRMTPGRDIRGSSHTVHPDSINLDKWYDGNWSYARGGSGLPEPSRRFYLEPYALIERRNWIEGQIETLAINLCDLASVKGLK